jgi:hypothetical protein
VTSLTLPGASGDGCAAAQGDIAAGPRSPTAWVSVTLDDGRFQVVELRLPALRIVHLSQAAIAICGARLSATLDGVWAGFATGMLGGAVRFEAATGEVSNTLHAPAGRFIQPDSGVYLVSATRPVRWRARSRVRRPAQRGG